MKILLFYDLQLLKEKLTDCREKKKKQVATLQLFKWFLIVKHGYSKWTITQLLICLELHFIVLAFNSSLLNDIFLKIRIDFLTKKLKVIQSFMRCNSKFSKHSLPCMRWVSIIHLNKICSILLVSSNRESAEWNSKINKWFIIVLCHWFGRLNNLGQHHVYQV